MANDDGPWDEAKLMGKGETGKGAEAAKADPLLWGIPGYLTEEEAKVYVSKRFPRISVFSGLKNSF